MSLIMGPSSRSFFIASHQESVVRRKKQKCLGWSHTARQFITRRKGIFDSSFTEKSGNLYFGSGGLASSCLSVSLSRSSGGLYT